MLAEFFRNDSALSQAGLPHKGASLGQDFDMFPLTPAAAWADTAFLPDAPPRGSELDFAFASSQQQQQALPVSSSRRSGAACIAMKESSSSEATDEGFCLDDAYLFSSSRGGCEAILPSGAQPAAQLIDRSPSGM
jgi:hypothetical protein